MTVESILESHMEILKSINSKKGKPRGRINSNFKYRTTYGVIHDILSIFVNTEHSKANLSALMHGSHTSYNYIKPIIATLENEGMIKLLTYTPQEVRRMQRQKFGGIDPTKKMFVITEKGRALYKIIHELHNLIGD